MEGKPASAFAPFRHRVYAVLWTATLISNIGTWMFNVTSGWLMAELSPSPLMVSLVQAATALPIFLFALPAGALGDIFDRRKLLLVTQLGSALAMFAFGGLLWMGIDNAGILLLFTFLAGSGAAFAMPAWQAIVPRLVPKDALQSAIALGGVSVNIARALGPALGGLILSAAGAIATVTCDAISYLVVVAGLLWWHATVKNDDDLPRERVVGAMQAGIRFSLRSHPLLFTIVRALAFFTFASAYWALLPLVAKNLLHGGPGLYGVLLTALGGGALAGAFLLPKLKPHINPDRMVALGTVMTALALGLFAFGGSEAAGICASVISGTAWIMVLSSLNVSTQVALPDWVRARGLALFQMMFFGAMTLGSIVWGKAADIYGLPVALTASAALALLFIPLTWRYKLNLGENHDHMPSGHWPEPILLTHQSHHQGPVLVTVEYHIADADRDAFMHLMHRWGQIRLRDGAVQWGFFEDVEHRGRIIETFVVESWVAHLRQHRRVSQSDKVLQDKINALHKGDKPPRVMHAVTPRKGHPPATLPEHHHD
jgi:MFS family permease